MPRLPVSETLRERIIITNDRFAILFANTAKQGQAGLALTQKNKIGKAFAKCSILLRMANGK